MVNIADSQKIFIFIIQNILRHCLQKIKYLVLLDIILTLYFILYQNHQINILTIYAALTSLRSFKFRGI